MSSWSNVRTLDSRSYICGYCGNPLASNVGIVGDIGTIYICHFCSRPTYFDNSGTQTPGCPYGDRVENTPQEVEALYDEARNCVSCNAYTASVLCCRKLLMNIAVSKGAEEGLKFAQYIEYLAGKGFVPPGGEGWVDHIRNKGNDATHEIALMTKEDAEELITFAEMLLKFIYEFPKRIAKRTPETNGNETKA